MSDDRTISENQQCPDYGATLVEETGGRVAKASLHIDVPTLGAGALTTSATRQAPLDLFAQISLNPSLARLPRGLSKSI